MEGRASDWRALLAEPLQINDITTVKIKMVGYSNRKQFSMVHVNNLVFPECL